MPSCVQEHVGNRVPDLPRRTENVEVVSIREHTASTMEGPVHRPREPRSDGLHARREIFAACCLDDRMQVIGLDRIMHDSKAPALAAGAQACLELADESRVAQ